MGGTVSIINMCNLKKNGKFLKDHSIELKYLKIISVDMRFFVVKQFFSENKSQIKRRCLFIIF